MKHIVKNQEPQTFTKWKAQANQNWQPTFADLRGKEKQAVYHALFIEQGYICCYCQCRITEDECHIDHLQPQHGKETIDSLDYSNFVCSCQRNLIEGEPRRCGNAKGNAQLPISPLDPTCESRFKFKNNGEIYANQPNDQPAEDTINILNLNSRNIICDRLEIIAFFDEEIDLKTDAEVCHFIRESLTKDQESKYQTYWTMIKDLYSYYLKVK